MRCASIVQTMLLVAAATTTRVSAFLPAKPKSFLTPRGGMVNLNGARSLRASAVSSPSVKRLSNPAEFLSDVDVFIFDCDGVIWRGDSLIDKVPAVLDKLREQGKRSVW